jgi:hypothetical protein
MTSDDDPRMERFVDAVQAGIDVCPTADYEKFAMLTLQMMGQDFLPHISADDRGRLFSPVGVEQGKKTMGGGILILQDRAVVAWRFGFTGGKKGHLVVPLHSVSSVAELPAGTGRPRGARTLEVRATSDLQLTFAAEVNDALFTGLRDALCAHAAS